MSKFAKFRGHYIQPERLTVSEARERRLNALLEKERRFLDVPNFQAGVEAVRSRVESEKSLSFARQIVDEPLAKAQKARSIRAALATFVEKDFANPEARAAYRLLRTAQAAQQEKSRSWQNVTPSGGDKRRFDPTGKDYASTIHGTIARIGSVARVFTGGAPGFLNAPQVLPCIQRVVRREVMFALGHGGKGYRVRHRKNWQSGVPC